MSASEEKKRSQGLSRFFNPDYEFSKKEHEMIANTIDRLIDKQHDLETERILEKQRLDLGSAGTSEERAHITRQCIAALRRSLFASCEARTAIVSGMN